MLFGDSVQPASEQRGLTRRIEEGSERSFGRGGIVGELGRGGGEEMMDGGVGRVVVVAVVGGGGGVSSCRVESERQATKEGFVEVGAAGEGEDGGF